MELNSYTSEELLLMLVTLERVNDEGQFSRAELEEELKKHFLSRELAGQPRLPVFYYDLHCKHIDRETRMDAQESDIERVLSQCNSMRTELNALRHDVNVLRYTLEATENRLHNLEKNKDK